MVSVKNDSGIQTRYILDLIWYSVFLKLMPGEPIIERENSAVHTLHLHSIATLRSGETFRCHRNRDSGRRKLDGSYSVALRSVFFAQQTTRPRRYTHPTIRHRDLSKGSSPQITVSGTSLSPRARCRIPGDMRVRIRKRDARTVLGSGFRRGERDSTARRGGASTRWDPTSPRKQPLQCRRFRTKPWKLTVGFPRRIPSLNADPSCSVLKCHTCKTYTPEGCPKRCAGLTGLDLNNDNIDNLGQYKNQPRFDVTTS